MIGTDSHTPNGGGLGGLCIGKDFFLTEKTYILSLAAITFIALAYVRMCGPTYGNL